MIETMNGLIGGGDFWCRNLDGTTNIQTLTLNATTVTFQNVPYNAGYGYALYVDMDYSAGAQLNPPVKIPPKRTVELPTVTTVDGMSTVTYTISKVTANQVGGHCQLRIVR